MSSAQSLPLPSFNVVEATIGDIHAAYKAGTLTVRQLVQMYLDRIAAYDKQGPAINAVISLNPTALDEADGLDAAFRKTGFVGRLHGIPVLMKDQADLRGLPTTLGSTLFKDYMPERDCFVAAKLKKAGVIFLGKATLGNSEAAIRTARCSDRPATSTICSAPRAAHQADRAPPCRPIFARSR